MRNDAFFLLMLFCKSTALPVSSIEKLTEEIESFKWLDFLWFAKSLSINHMIFKY